MKRLLDFMFFYDIMLLSTERERHADKLLSRNSRLDLGRSRIGKDNSVTKLQRVWPKGHTFLRLNRSVTLT